MPLIVNQENPDPSNRPPAPKGSNPSITESSGSPAPPLRKPSPSTPPPSSPERIYVWDCCGELYGYDIPWASWKALKHPYKESTTPSGGWVSNLLPIFPTTEANDPARPYIYLYSLKGQTDRAMRDHMRSMTQESRISIPNCYCRINLDDHVAEGQSPNWDFIATLLQRKYLEHQESLIR